MLNTKVTGSGGIPIVFLHGYCEDSSLWDAQVKSLEDHHKIINLDLPGFGYSKPLAGEFNIDDVARVVHNHLQKELNLDEYIVIGHSLGGYISLALKDLYPKSILAIGLVNSTSYSDSAEKMKLRDKTVTFIAKHGVKHFLGEFVKNLFAPVNQQEMALNINKVMKMGQNLPVETIIGYMKAMRNRPDRSNLLIRQKNVLFVGGAQDSHISSKDIHNQIKVLGEPKNGIIFKTVAHMSMFEAPKQLEKAIKSFILSL